MPCMLESLMYILSIGMLTDARSRNATTQHVMTCHREPHLSTCLDQYAALQQFFLKKNEFR